MSRKCIWMHPHVSDNGLYSVGERCACRIFESKFVYKSSAVTSHDDKFKSMSALLGLCYNDETAYDSSPFRARDGGRNTSETLRRTVAFHGQWSICSSPAFVYAPRAVASAMWLTSPLTGGCSALIPYLFLSARLQIGRVACKPVVQTGVYQPAVSKPCTPSVQLLAFNFYADSSRIR